MEIIFVNTPFQSKNTKNPQLINGELREWVVESYRTKIGEDLITFLKREWEYKNRNPNGVYVSGFYLYNVEPINGIVDQNNNFTGQSALIVRMAPIKND